MQKLFATLLILSTLTTRAMENEQKIVKTGLALFAGYCVYTLFRKPTLEDLKKEKESQDKISKIHLEIGLQSLGNEILAK